MTAPTPPVSDVLRGIEGLVAQSLENLVAALDLVTKAANADAAAVETAISVLGEARGRTVVELARVSMAGEAIETLNAIGAAISGMLSAIEPPAEAAPASVPSAARARVEMPASAETSGRVELFGIKVPAGRMGEAEEVVATARTSVAQNRKANPYDHYRGKNAWCKSLFLAAFSQMTADAAATAAAVLEEASPEPPPAPVPPPPPRQSVAASGPVRAPRPAPVEIPARLPPPRAEALVSPPRPQQPGNRLHAHGATAQTIPEEVLQQSATAQTPPRGRQSFFRNR